MTHMALPDLGTQAHSLFLSHSCPCLLWLACHSARYFHAHSIISCMLRLKGHFWDCPAGIRATPLSVQEALMLPYLPPSMAPTNTWHRTEQYFLYWFVSSTEWKFYGHEGDALLTLVSPTPRRGPDRVGPQILSRYIYRRHNVYHIFLFPRQCLLLELQTWLTHFKWPIFWG